jgi:hypothetical protein
MKNQINEIKRMQQLAGVINEEESMQQPSIGKAFEHYNLHKIIPALMEAGYHIDDIVNYIKEEYFAFFQIFKKSNFDTDPSTGFPIIK